MLQRYRNRTGERGFTLAEILVTTAIFAIIMIAALTVYDRSNQVFSTSTTAANTQQSTRIGFEKLVSDLRMTGFDYNRGGIPTGAGQFAQPDEQIEYAGATAIVMRANFDYNVNVSRGNGLAPDGTGGTSNYYALNSNGTKIFPYITTDNTEIVAYVLRSTAPGAANSDSISFYADTDVPRRAYPNVSGTTSNGHAENRVTISGIDITNNNPPYTLYRVTVDDINNNRQGTPVAENIRSLNFTYYSDGLGSQVLQIPGTPPTDITQTRNAGGGTVATSNTGAIGGDGQYDPNANNGAGAGTFTDRTVRSLIQSVRVSVIGMDATPTNNYQNPTETNASYKNYREYSLSSLIVPRNLGLQGFPEPNFYPPNPPVVTGACVGHCAAPFLTWSPPTAGGPVTIGYKISWDTSAGGTFASNMVVYDPSASSAQLTDCACDPSQTYLFRVTAINENGESAPSNTWSVRPQNSTKPSPPSAISATTAQANQVTLSWVAPVTNAVTTMTCAGSAATSGTNIPTQETIHFQVARSTNPSFTPSSSDIVLDFDTASQPAMPAPGGTVSWVDGPASGTNIQSLHPPAACVQYYYRVRALDRCYKSGSMNSSGNPNDSISDWFPAAGQPGWPGQATSSSTPSTPTVMTLDPNPSNTVCPKANGLCNIALNWNAVVTDTNNLPVAVDTYTLLRERRIQGTTTWSPDTTNGTNGMKDLPGFSSKSGSPVGFIDTDVAYQDPLAGVYEYRYSVSAKICNTPSPSFSNTVIYPGCNFSVAFGAPGASSGSGSLADPWVLGYGDSVTVTRSGGNALTGVVFQLMQNGTNVGSALTISGAGPYTYPWVDQPGGVTYELWIRLTDSAGCTMTYVRYINQQTPAPCTFQDLGTAGRPGTPPSPSLGTTGSQPRSVTFDFAYNATAATNFALTNNQPTVGTSEAMKFNISSGNPGGPFNGSFTLVWADVNGLHPEMQLVSVDWIPISSTGTAGTTYNQSVSQPLTYTTLAAAVTATQTTFTVASATTLGTTGSTGIAYIDSEAVSYTVTNATTLTVTRGVLGTTATTHALAAEVEKQMTTVVNAPSSFPDVQPGTSIEFVLHMTYDSSHKNTKLTTSGTIIRNICVKYKVLSDPTLTQSCNLWGRLTTNTTANPTSCD